MWIVTTETIAPWGEAQVSTARYRWKWLAKLCAWMESAEGPDAMSRTATVKRAD
jgi:hypothetical protein